MRHLNLIPLLFLCILGACIVSKQKNNSPGEQKNAGNSEQKAQLIFLNFIITKDSLQDNSTIQLAKIKITDGSIKKEKLPGVYKPAYPDNLRCVLEDRNGVKIYETVIEHPLFRRYEYGQDNGAIASKRVVLKEAVFFIRTGYNQEMKYILFYETISSLPEKEIARLELKP